MNKFSSQVLRFNVKTCIAHSGTRLSIKFQSNYQTKNDHNMIQFFMRNALDNKVQKITQEKQEGI